MKIDLRLICSFLALLCMLAAPAAVRADTITYTFTSQPNPPAPNVTSFSFSYTGTAPISVSSTFMPLDSCSVVLSLTTDRTCDSVELGASTGGNDRIKLLKTGANEYQITLPIAFFAAFGTQTDASGNSLTISDTPAVPEPGSIMLLGTGLLGLAGTMRRCLFR